MTDMTAEWFAAHDFWQIGKTADDRAMLLVTEDEYNAIRQALTAPRVPEGIVYNLKELSGSRYVSYIEKMRSTECLGHAYKMQNGCFGEAELNAHTEAAKLLGEHRAFFEAAKMLTAAPAPAEPVVCKHCGNPTMHIGDVCYACCQSPAEQTTDVNGMLVTHDSDGRVSKIVQGGVPAHDELAKLRKRVKALEGALDGLLAIIGDSRGVTGYHLNGDIAEWDEFEEVEQAARLRGGSDE